MLLCFDLHDHARAASLAALVTTTVLLSQQSNWVPLNKEMTKVILRFRNDQYCTLGKRHCSSSPNRLSHPRRAAFVIDP